MTKGRSFGSVTLSEDGLGRKQWIIQTEPQVMVRLKRVFERIEKSEVRAARLADTLENARELSWFLERYPMEVAEQRYLNKRAREHEARETRVASILSPGYVPQRPIELALPPRPYQRIAAELMLDRGSLLLGDELGTGKTVSAICTLVAENALPALVVTLTHLPKQWEAEIKRFAPGLAVHRIRKGTPYDVTLSRGQRTRYPDVLIINYQKLTGWGEELSKRVKTLIVDEAQELRHRRSGREDSLKYTAAKLIADAADRRLGLTGTPIYGFGGEMFNVMDVIAPGSLGTLEEFRREWCTVTTGYGGQTKLSIKDPVAFGMYLREQGLMLRRTRKDVGRELPPLTKIFHYVDADTAALDDIRGAAINLAKIILQQGGSGLHKMRAADELDWRLRQATGVGKAPQVAAFVRMLVESSGEPVVLFAWHRECYSLFANLLRDLNPVFYTGTESGPQKERAKAAFLSGESKVLIMSLRSGAGLDGLQAKASHVVFGELDWSPQVHAQCIGRLFRDGQMNGVMAYFLIADAGSDPSIIEALGAKKRQSDGVMDPEIVLDEEGSAAGDAQLVKGANVDRIRKLAEMYLAQHRTVASAQLDDEEAA